MVTAAQRARLSPSEFACPATRNYPIPRDGGVVSNWKAVIRNAHGRWHQKATIKCAGGHRKILKALCRIGASPQDASCPIK